jgi:hypothetical protein
LLLGCLLGILYIKFVFGFANTEGEEPALAITLEFGHFKLVNGNLYIGGKHIHHWIVYLILLPIFYVFEYYAPMGFSLALIAHGLRYNDAFEL